MPQIREAVIVSSVRTAIGKAFKGTPCRAARRFGGHGNSGALARVPGLDPREIEDVILGCAEPEAEQGMNVARIASLRAGLPAEASAMTVNRFCSSGLQTIAMAAERIMLGGAEVIVAGGTESMSNGADGGPQDLAESLADGSLPDAYLGMGLTAENLARKYGITREQADAFSLASLRRLSPQSQPESSRTRSCPSKCSSTEYADAAGTKRPRPAARPSPYKRKTNRNHNYIRHPTKVRVQILRLRRSQS